MTYAAQIALADRTPQELLIVKVPQCANWYAQQVLQEVFSCSDFTVGTWTASGGTTVTADTINGPDDGADGGFPADTLAFAAAGDNIRAPTNFTAAAGLAFTGSVWLKATGAGTITIDLHDVGAGEIATTQVNVTTTWTRFWIHKLFTGAAAGNPSIRIRRQAGDLAAVYAWGANIWKNPGNADREIKFPTLPFTFGNTSTCAATDAGNGSRCYYSFSTCQDVANYNEGKTYEIEADLQGLKQFNFCRKDAPLATPGLDVMPLLVSSDFAPQKIDPQNAITQSERVKFGLVDHAATWNWNQDKANNGALTNTTTPSGTLWRRFIKIHPNYANPLASATFKAGFVESTATEDSYETRGKYLIKNLSLSSGGILNMECTDRLKLLKVKIPAKISATNLLNGAINNAVTAITIDDATEVTVPGAGYNVCLELDPDGTPEFVNVTATDPNSNILTVQRGRWGTAAASHADNTVFREVLQFGTEHPTPSNTPLGLPGKDAVKQILYRAGLTAAEVDSATIDSEFDTWLPGSVSGSTESGTVFKRAGTVVGSGNGAIKDQTDAEALLRQLRETCILDLWVNESQQVTGALFAPVRPTVTLADLSETSDVLRDSIEIDDNEQSRFTRVIIAYELQADKDGTKLSDYAAYAVAVSADAEGSGSYGEPRTKAVLSPWIKIGDDTTAEMLAIHALNRLKSQLREIDFDLELRGDGNQCGDCVYLTTQRIVNADGSTDAQRIVRLIKKQRDATRGRISFTAIDEGLGTRYAFIAPDANAALYDDADASERRYAYIASDDGTIPTAGDLGYAIW